MVGGVETVVKGEAKLSFLGDGSSREWAGFDSPRAYRSIRRSEVQTLIINPMHFSCERASAFGKMKKETLADA